MTHIQKVLDAVEIPVTLEQVGTRLSAIAEAVCKLGNAGQKSPALSRDFNGLMDLWLHSDLQMATHVLATGQDHPSKDSLKRSIALDEQYPRTDPLTLLTLAANYRLMTASEAHTLKAEFMAKASAAAGHKLTQAQVKKLHKLFRSYNPVGHMTPE